MAAFKRPVLGRIELFHPRAFENLKRFLENPGVGVFVFFGGKGVHGVETEALHFFLGCVPGKAAGDVLGEILLGVGQKLIVHLPCLDMPLAVLEVLRHSSTIA